MVQMKDCEKATRMPVQVSGSSTSRKVVERRCAKIGARLKQALVDAVEDRQQNEEAIGQRDVDEADEGRELRIHQADLVGDEAGREQRIAEQPVLGEEHPPAEDDGDLGDEQRAERQADEEQPPARRASARPASQRHSR